MLQEKIMDLANVQLGPCVTISFNTHRTFPENAADVIRLKNFCKEAEQRLIAEFEPKTIANIVEKLKKIPDMVDAQVNLESLHVFVSELKLEILRSHLNVGVDQVQIADTFALGPLINAYNRSVSYLVLLLSNGGVHLYYANNGEIVGEVTNEDFPFDENPHFHTDPDKLSDAKAVDKQVEVFFNVVDKALVKVHRATGQKCVVICTAKNYSMLIEVADQPSAYYGFAPVDYNHVKTHQISTQAWEVVSDLQNEREKRIISQVKEAVGSGNVLTDTAAIYKAAKEGRGELLIVQGSYRQPAIVNNDNATFQTVTDVTLPGVIDDIASVIAWNVISKKGEVMYTDQKEAKELGDMVLKVRF